MDCLATIRFIGCPDVPSPYSPLGLPAASHLEYTEEVLETFLEMEHDEPEWWRELILRCFRKLKDRGEKLFDPNLWWTHGGVVREFLGRHENYPEQLIKACLGKSPENVVVLGGGTLGCEAVEVAQRYGEDTKVTSIDLAPFLQEGGIPIIRSFARKSDGSLVTTWVGKSKKRQYDVRGRKDLDGMTLLSISDEHTGKIPLIDLALPQEIGAFWTNRKRAHFIQDDLFSPAESKCLFGQADVVYIRNVLCLYDFNQTLRLWEQALQYGRKDGFYLVWSDSAPAKGYPICQGMVCYISLDRPSRSKILALESRPGFFLPSEVPFFAARWFNFTTESIDGMYDIKRNQLTEVLYRMLVSRG